MAINENITPSKIFDTRGFMDVLHATNIAVWRHFADMLFGGDDTRIVYAPTDYAFRARQKVTGTSNLELPFMNFKIDTIENSGVRPWWNQYAQARGMYVPELKSRIRFSPITINYDATLYAREDIDSHYLIDQLFWDDSNETILKPTVDVEVEDSDNPGTFLNHELVNIGVLGYGLRPYSQYNESDWLEKERVQAHDLNMTIQTWTLRGNYNITIPTKVIFSFASTHNLATGITNPTAVYEAVIDHLNGTVGPWTKS